MLRLFTKHSISSTYWIWRSMAKGGRDVDAPVWGFELVHNSGFNGRQSAAWVYEHRAGTMQIPEI